MICANLHGFRTLPLPRLFALLTFALCAGAAASLDLETEVLVVGGGTSGVTAAIQAARSGADVILTEETPWLGGMLTAAGVSCTDGNHSLPSGLWAEFRQKIYDYYGGPAAVRTGWVSMTCFEPHVGAAAFREMVDAEPRITLFHGFWPVEVFMDAGRVTGAALVNEAGERIEVRARVTVDATEYGDVMARAGVEYRIGQESAAQTGEPGVPPTATDIIQDLTLVAILKDYGEGADVTIPEPPGYDPALFAGCCGDGAAHTCDHMMDYGKLPNGKYMINWPIHGNDYYVNLLDMTREERIEALKAARLLTLGFVYYKQTVLGYSRIGIAEDEYPTSDGLALIPYNRESRRMVGVVDFRIYDILEPYSSPTGDLYKTGIAVGDYPVDHHHTKAPGPTYETFPRIPAFTIPYGALVPATVNGLIVAEHSISVTHMVNGCTRLQPCVMLTGQAAGAAAALCAIKGREPRAIAIRELQQALLDAGAMLVPTRDAAPGDWAFEEIQRVSLAGAMRSALIAQGWSGNRWEFAPDRASTLEEARESLALAAGLAALPPLEVDLAGGGALSRLQLVCAAWEMRGRPAPAPRAALFSDVAETSPGFAAVQYAAEAGWLAGWAEPPEFRPDGAATRRELAVVLDRALDPFGSLPVAIQPEPRPVPYTRLLEPLWKLHHDPAAAGRTGAPPAWFPSTGDLVRDLAFNPRTNHLLVTDNAGRTIHILDPATGAELGALNNAGIGAATLGLSSVAVTEDGVIFGAQYNRAPARIYRWQDESAAPALAFSATLAENAGRRLDALGAGSSTRLAMASAGSTAAFHWIETSDGVNFSLASTASGGEAGTEYGVYGLALWDANLALGKGNTGALFAWRRTGGAGAWEWDANWSPGADFQTASITQVRRAPGAPPRLLALAPRNHLITLQDGAQSGITGGLIFDADSAPAFTLLAAAPLEAPFGNTNSSGGVAMDATGRRLFVLIGNNGVAAYGLPESFQPSTWIFY